MVQGGFVANPMNTEEQKRMAHQASLRLLLLLKAIGEAEELFNASKPSSSSSTHS